MVHFFNDYKHVSYLKLGKFKGMHNQKGDWRYILIEVLDTKTGQTRVIGKFFNRMGPPDYKLRPRIINFRHHPYVMYEYKKAKMYKSGNSWKVQQHFAFYNHKLNRTHRIFFNDGYTLISTMNLVPIMQDQGTFSDILVLGKLEGKTLHLRAVRMPDQKIVLQTSTTALGNIGSSGQYSVFYNLLQADYIQK